MRIISIPIILVLLALPLCAQERNRERKGGFLGIRFVEVENGLKIESVLSGSPAEKEGFHAGDVILKIDAKSRRQRKAPSPINGDYFLQALWMSKKVTLTILRKGKTISLGTSIEVLDKTVSVGEEAPGFSLKSPDGKSTTALADLTGKKPVVLIFGSYT